MLKLTRNCAQVRRLCSIFKPELKPNEEQLKSLLNEAANFDDYKNESGKVDNEWSTLPYTKEAAIDANVFAPEHDPDSTSVILFPGQGSQFVGMSKELVKYPMARDMFEIASEVLGYDLQKLCANGPVSKLNDTVYAQPAIVVCSLGAVEKLKEERPLAVEKCTTTAGFSIGELTALIFSGAIPFDKGIELVRIRATAMKMAADQTKGTMATVHIGADSEVGKACEAARQWCTNLGIENPQCNVASYLSSGMKVIAGNVEAIDFVSKNLESFKIRKLTRLANVSGAFHTNLMGPAHDVFAEAVRHTKFEPPIIHCYSNVTGKKYGSVTHIKRLLPKQIVRPVRWEQTMHSIYSRTELDFPRTYFCGPKSILSRVLFVCNGKASKKALSITV